MEKDLLIVQGLLVAGYRVDAKTLEEDEKPYPTRLDSEIVYLREAEIFQNGQIVAEMDVLGVRFENVGAIAAGSMIVNLSPDEKMGGSIQAHAGKKSKADAKK